MRNDLVSEERRSVVRGREWSIAQIVQGVAGLVLVVLGGIALARAGLKFDPPGQATVGYVHTTWLALLELGAGLLLLVGATSARDRTLGIFMGLALTAFGIIMAAAPDAFGGRLSDGDATPGVILAIIGAACALTSMVAPSRMTQYRQRGRIDDREVL